jgi:hypothetical protein
MPTEWAVVASQTYIEKSKAALLINSCEFDDAFPLSLAKTADEKFANFVPGYRRVHFDGVHHGFAARGDLVRPHISSFGYLGPQAISSHTDQSHRKGCQGRRIQGVRGMADQAFVDLSPPR